VNRNNLKATITKKERMAKMDMEKVIKELESLRDICNAKSNMAIGKGKVAWAGYANAADDALSMLKEQEKKEIKLHKKHVITWKRDDEFTMRKLYEAVCETLMDEGELIIARTDVHEKVDFVFYVTEGR
jgi:hypothetical protein